MPGLRAAGYVWESRVEGDADAVGLALEQREPEAPPAPGASVDEAVVLRGLRPGAAIVHLVQRRPWESDEPPLHEHVVHVRVG